VSTTVSMSTTFPVRSGCGSSPLLFAARRIGAGWRGTGSKVRRDPAELAAPTAPAEETLARAEDRELFMRALDCVELDRRSVFILFELDGLSMNEIVKLLRIPLFTGYSRLRTARAEFTSAVRRLRPRVEP